MIATLEFDMENPEDVLAHKRCTLATNAYLALLDVAMQVFRPARKHGYTDISIQSLVNETERSEELISLLEEKFYEILNDHQINLADLE